MRKEEKKVLEKSYLLRIFNLSFGVFSIFPLTVLFYLLFRFGDEANSHLLIPLEHFRTLVMVLAATSLVIFLCVKRIFAKIVLLNYNIKQALLSRVDKKAIISLSGERGEVAELARTFGEIVGRLQENVRNLKDTKRTLHDVLSKVGKAIASMENFDSFILLILETAMDSLNAKRGAIFSLAGDDIELKASVGLGTFDQKQVIHVENILIEGVIKERRPVIASAPGGKEEKSGGLLAAPFMHIPLVCRDRVWGVLCVSGRRDEGNFSDDEVKIISNLGYQIAIAFENAALNKDVERAYFETMAALALAVEAKDEYSRGHSERVGGYAARIGRALGMVENDVNTLKDASRLHDIGKIGIDDSILKKPGPLEGEQWEVMKKHPEIGASIVKPLKSFQHLLGPIRSHHEFLDGSGYPDGLKADDIPVITRILIVADIYDAMTSDRAYRKALSMQDAKVELQTMVEQGKVDKHIVDIFLHLLEETKA